MPFDRRLLKNLDFVLLIVVLGMTALGVVFVYGATKSNPLAAGDPLSFFKRQLLSAIFGILLMLIAVSSDYQIFQHLSGILYWGNVGILGLVLLIGHSVSGAQAWIRLGPLSFQPSEFSKLLVIMTLANHLAEKEDIQSLGGLVSPLIHAAIPMGLILLQNDLGTMLVFLAVLLGMLYAAGARVRDLLILVGSGAVASPLIYFFCLKDYQRARLLIFINPYRDPLGEGYNVIQSTIAIGSGKFFGKGLFHGTQGQLNFLPAHHTDFIFSVVGEELGFIGAAIILLGFLFIILRSLATATQAKDDYGRLVCSGVASMLLFHVMVNVGMTMSIMPVTGIPLPFMSYGGSSLMANLAAIGLVLSIHMRRQRILF